MLRSLHITNFVLLDDCFIEFHPGLNVLTGETGTGKSILVGALSLLVGERGSPDNIRDADRDAIVEASFDLDAQAPYYPQLRTSLEESGIAWDPDTLLVRRIVSANGRSRIFLNNTQCLVKQLKEIGTLLIDLHGQHEHQSLLSKSCYLPLLDRFGHYADELDRYRVLYRQWRSVCQELQSLDDDDRERRRREDAIRFQLDEITRADPRVGEDDEIEARLRIIQHAEKLHECCRDILRTMTEETETKPALLDELDRVETMILQMQQYDEAIRSIAEILQPAAISIREATRELESYESNLEFDPDELARLQERYFLIKGLKKKYGASIEEILSYRQQIEQELGQIEHLDEKREKLQAVELDLRRQLIRAGSIVHERRRQTARTIEESITKELAPLGMHQAVFSIQSRYKYSPAGFEMGDSQPVLFGPDGPDEVDFLISTIPDKPARPLREVASGGEISRIMLAIKCVFSQADSVPLLVFDEIDVGVGGETANAVADRLRALSRTKQIVCITHLPQIASQADRNLRVFKTTQDDRLVSVVIPLEGKEREAELARMLGGKDSTASKRYARELLRTKK